MSDSFDPYYRWLGIPPAEQPPNHYRLLGLELFESSREVIDSVAMRHIAYLQDITDGPHVKEAQRMLNELAAARRCLLDAETRASYDRDLRDQLAERAKPPQAVPPVTKSSPDTHVSVKPLPSHVRPAASKARATTSASPVASLRLFWIAGAATIGLVAIIAFAMSAFRRDEPPALTVDQSGRRAARVSEASTDPTRPAELPPAHLEPATKSDAQPPAWTANSPVLDDGTAQVGPATPTPQDETDPSLANDRSITSPIPTDGLVLWLDAAEAATLDVYQGRVRRWSDRSTTSSDAESELAAERPFLVSEALHGKPAVGFDGTQACGVGTGDTLNVGPDFTIFYVYRGERGTLLSKGYGERESQFSLVDGGSTLLLSGQRCSVAEEETAHFAIRSIHADAQTVTCYLNGSAVGSMDATGCQIDTRYKFRIGCQTVIGVDLPDPFVGALAELIVFDTALTPADRDAVEDYLQAKWFAGGVFDQPQQVTEIVQSAPKVAPSQPSIEEPPMESQPPAQATEETDTSSNESPEETAPTAKIDLWVNVGGAEYSDPESGITWLECPGEGFACEGGRKASDENALNPVMGTAERGLNAFRADVPNGVYDVHLYFCDYWTSDPAARAFHIAVEQKVVRMNFSVVMAAGGSGNPITIPVLKVRVNDGRLDVDFRAQVGTTILNGVRIQQR